MSRGEYLTLVTTRPDTRSVIARQHMQRVVGGPGARHEPRAVDVAVVISIERAVCRS